MKSFNCPLAFRSFPTVLTAQSFNSIKLGLLFILLGNFLKPKKVGNDLKAKGQLNDFIDYVTTMKNEVSACQRGAVALFRRQKDSETVANSQDIQDFIKEYEKVINIKKQTTFINIYETLLCLHCVNLFLLAYSSGTQVNLFDNMNKFFNKYPLLSLVDNSYFDWANKPETDKTILSIFN